MARTYVDGPQDLDAAHAVQDGLRMVAREAAAGQILKFPDRSDVNAFFVVANEMLAITEVPARDRSLLRRLARAGIGPGLRYPALGMSAEAVADFEAGGRAELASLRFGDGPVHGGWIYPRSSLGDFGTDYGYRASIALTGLAALPLREAIYLKGVGDDGGAIYNGAHRYSWRMSAEAFPPVDSFWSLALYEQTPQGQLFFFDNPQSRYSIGSNTAGLVRDEEGGLTVLISNTPPLPADGAVTWLPAPSGPFALQLRAFRPKGEFVSGAYRPPAVASSA